jgi:glycosyltransferase involved in cell wall biosynthesis
VVINSSAQNALAHRCGLAATVIPNVLDFDHPPRTNPQRLTQLRKSLAIKDDTLTILQPTRIIRRKGIETAVELIKGLMQPHAKLVISHEGGDEGMAYVDRIQQYAQENEVNLQFAGALIGNPWEDSGPDVINRYSLWDMYPLADLVTFPSRQEGFGNALLEAIYFKKPVLVNRYQTYIEDIEPLGFDLISVDGFLTPDTLEQVGHVLESDQRRRQMVARNYDIARRFFSYSVLKKRLRNLLAAVDETLERQSFSDKIACPLQTGKPYASDPMRMAV